MLKQIRVVGAVVVDEGRILCAQRGPDGQIPGLWEFPGGKVEIGETIQDALRREFLEELGCVIAVGPEVATTVHSYDFAEVDLTTFWCRITEGELSAREHSALKWLPPNELRSVDWAPADLPSVVAIQRDFGV